MQFICLFYSKDFQIFIWKTIDFVENLEMTQKTGSGGSYSLRHYDAIRSKVDMGFTPKTPNKTKFPNLRERLGEELLQYVFEGDSRWKLR